jgi:hypothetical protein
LDKSVLSLLIVVCSVGSTSVFDPMNFENQFIVIEDTGESVLADSKFCERAASEWLEELIGSSSFRVDNLVEF